MFLSVCLFACLPSCLSGCLPVYHYLSVYIWTYLSISSCSVLSHLISSNLISSQPTNQPTYLSIYLSFFSLSLSLPNSPSVELPLCQSFPIFSVSLYICISISISFTVYLIVYLIIYLYVFLCICLPIYPSIYLPIYRKQLCDASFESGSWQIPNEASLRDFLKKWNCIAPKRSNSARLPPNFEFGNIKNEVILRHFFQKWKVECKADSLMPMRFAIFASHLFKVLRRPRYSEARPYEVLNLSHKIILANLKIGCSKIQPHQINRKMRLDLVRLD